MKNPRFLITGIIILALGVVFAIARPEETGKVGYVFIAVGLVIIIGGSTKRQK